MDMQIGVLYILTFSTCIPVPTIDYTDIKATLNSLSKLIPDNEFYKYNDLWSRSTQQLVFLIIFESYLKRREIVNIIPEVEQLLEGMTLFLCSTKKNF